MHIAAKKDSEHETQVSVASYVRGVGMSVPDRVVPNDHFTSYLETSDEWIRERTGIEERRWADAEVSASELAAPACLDAIRAAGISTDDIDGVITATVTPDYIFPSTACFIQNRLGIKQGFAFDVNAVCSGFLYALVTADSLIRSGQCQNILVVGVDLYSRIINPNDRTTCVLFADGAGALVLSSVATNGGTIGSVVTPATSQMRGMYASKLRADGAHTGILCVPSGTAKTPTPETLASGEHYLTMAGREVFKLAVRSLVDISQTVLDTAGVSANDVDHFVSHQANKRILQAMGKQLGVSEDRIPMNVQKYGNTSAASVPILLAECVATGTIKEGDLVLLSAFGGGVSWGAALVRW